MLTLHCDFYCGTRYCQWVFSSITFCCGQDLCYQLTPFLTDKYFILSIWEVLLSLNVLIPISSVKREDASMSFCWQPHLFLELVVWIIRMLLSSLQNHKKIWHRFWWHLKHTVIFMSNIRISASVKINWSLTWTPSVMTAALKINGSKFYNWFGRISQWWKKTVNDQTWLHLVSFANHL